MHLLEFILSFLFKTNVNVICTRKAFLKIKSYIDLVIKQNEITNQHSSAIFMYRGNSFLYKQQTIQYLVQIFLPVFILFVIIVIRDTLFVEYVYFHRGGFEDDVTFNRKGSVFKRTVIIDIYRGPLSLIFIVSGSLLRC